MNNAVKITLWLISGLIALSIGWSIWYKMLVALQLFTLASILTSFIVGKLTYVKQNAALNIFSLFISGAGVGAMAYHGEINLLITIIAIIIFICAVAQTIINNK